jgi:hypothetical protein
MRHTPSLVIIAWLCSAPALAQPPATPPADGPAQTLSLNPFGLMLEWPNVEYERKISQTATLGAAAAHNAFMEYSNVELLARYYPQGEALHGFYLGARAGGFGIEVTEYHYPTVPVPRGDPRSYPPYPVVTTRREIVPGVGLEVGYNWLLGREQRIAIGLGFGLTRLLRDGGDEDYFMPPTLPHFRIVNVGIAF